MSDTRLEELDFTQQLNSPHSTMAKEAVAGLVVQAHAEQQFKAESSRLATIAEQQRRHELEALDDKNQEARDKASKDQLSIQDQQKLAGLDQIIVDTKKIIIDTQKAIENLLVQRQSLQIKHQNIQAAIQVNKQTLKQSCQQQVNVIAQAMQNAFNPAVATLAQGGAAQVAPGVPVIGQMPKQPVGAQPVASTPTAVQPPVTQINQPAPAVSVPAPVSEIIKEFKDTMSSIGLTTEDFKDYSQSYFLPRYAQTYTMPSRTPRFAPVTQQSDEEEEQQFNEVLSSSFEDFYNARRPQREVQNDYQAAKTIQTIQNYFGPMLKGVHVTHVRRRQDLEDQLYDLKRQRENVQYSMHVIDTEGKSFYEQLEQAQAMLQQLNGQRQQMMDHSQQRAYK